MLIMYSLEKEMDYQELNCIFRIAISCLLISYLLLLISLHFKRIYSMNCSTIKRYGNTLSGMNYLHVNNMEYCHVESLSNNIIREIRCNIEEKWMKVRERSYNSDSCIEINLNELKIHDIIDFHGKKDEKYYYREGKQPFYDKLVPAITSQDSIYQWRRQYVRENKSGVVPTLTANMGTGGHNVPLILTDSGEIRKLTPKECFNGQGYPESFKLPKDESNGQLYKQAGNSVVVPVINRIAEKICEAIDGYENVDGKRKEGKYALIYSDIDSRFEGQSYVQSYADSLEELNKIVEESDIPLLTDEEYLKLIQKKKSAKFYMIEEV